MECLEQVRKTHGNDCMIVHSFKQPDSYCIIVAVESEGVKIGAQLVSSVVGKSEPQAIPVASKGGYSDLTVPTLSTPVTNNSLEHPTAEISPTILGLARKLGALSEDKKGPTEHAIDVSQKEFEALSFSEVLNDVVSQSTFHENKAPSHIIKTLSRNNEEQIDRDTFFDLNETQTSHTSPPLSDSAMLFSSIMSQCIKMGPRENFVGT